MAKSTACRNPSLLPDVKYSAAIFDLDGTLTYTLEDLWVSTNHALSLMGLPRRSLQEVRLFVGNGVGRLIRRAMPEGTSQEDYERCLSLFKDHYVRHCFDHTRLYDGVDELLLALRERGVAVAIVSNKLQAGVDELWRKFFSLTVSVAVGEHDGLSRKPAPDMVDEAIRRLGVSKAECLYVGDSEVDILTALGASLPCVSVLWGFRTREELERAGATTFISRPDELLGYFTD